MNQDRIIKAYEAARDEYAEYGVNTDKALEQFDEIYRRNVGILVTAALGLPA